MRTSHYVGVTGFMSKREVQEVLDARPKGTQRKLMVGVLASTATLWGGAMKHPSRYPAWEKLPEIFIDSPHVLNLIHFTSRQIKNREALLTQLLHITQLGGPFLHGLQLNMVWPEIEVLEAYRQRYPDKLIVLQCSVKAMQAVHNYSAAVAERLGEYHQRGAIDYALIDPSCGKGIPFEPAMMLKYLAHLSQRVPGLRPVVAGGLGPNSMELLHPLKEKFSNFSIDAEGAVRNDEDHLDVGLAKEYVAKAFALLK